MGFGKNLCNNFRRSRFNLAKPQTSEATPVTILSSDILDSKPHPLPRISFPYVPYIELPQNPQQTPLFSVCNVGSRLKIDT